MYFQISVMFKIHNIKKIKKDLGIIMVKLLLKIKVN